MDVATRNEIERACERLVTQYCHFVDHGEASKIADLFAKDGVWTSPENSMNGQEEIRAGFALREANKARMSRHVCNNFLVDVIDEDHAGGTVYLTLYRHDGKEGRAVSPLNSAVMVGEYRDRFVRTSEGWRFEHREVEVSFVRRAT